MARKMGMPGSDDQICYQIVKSEMGSLDFKGALLHDQRYAAHVYHPISLCVSVLRIPDVYPGSWFLPIPDPGSKNRKKREGWKKIVVIPFCSHKFYKIEIFCYFWNAGKKIWPNFQRIIELFTQKVVTKPSKYGFGIRDPEKTYSGSRNQGSKRHRIPDPQHCCVCAETERLWRNTRRDSRLTPGTSRMSSDFSSTTFSPPEGELILFNRILPTWQTSVRYFFIHLHSNINGK